MNNLVKFAILSVVGAFPNFTRAQECMQSIGIKSAISGDLDGWRLSGESSTHSLSGLQVVEGKLNEEPGKNARLKPMQDSAGNSLWEFRDDVGEKEVWMVCMYRDVSLKLSRRVDPTARGCRVLRSSSTDRHSDSVRALCE